MGIVTDQIADMLTQIRNGAKAHKSTVSIPSSKIKEKIAHILVKEGFVESAKTSKEGVKSTLNINLKYTVANAPVIKGIKRISKPGLRVYAPSQDMPKVLNGLGIAIVSTTSGIMTAKDAKKSSLGGEVIAYVW